MKSKEKCDNFCETFSGMYQKYASTCKTEEELVADSKLVNNTTCNSKELAGLHGCVESLEC